MLRQRLITALVAIAVVAGVVLFTPRGVVGAVLALVALAGAWEWTAFAGYSTSRAKIIYVLVTAAALLVCGLTLSVPDFAAAMVVVGVAWWLLVVVGLTVFSLARAGASVGAMPAWAIGLCGLLTLIPAWEGVVALRGGVDGAGRLLFVLALVWVADSGAYAAGRLWGRRRLAPRISPGKTWEGVAGGLAAASLVGVAGGLYFQYALAVFVPVCILTAAFSVVGDLGESFFKRLIGIKDSGAVFPGHGGVLDRIDSVCAAVPVFYLCLWALRI